jgi:hypothetical protein
MPVENYDGTICSAALPGLRKKPRSRRPAHAGATDIAMYECGSPNMWVEFRRRAGHKGKSMTQLRHDYTAWKHKNERRNRSVHSRVVEVGGDSLRELDPHVDFLEDRSLYTSWQWPERFKPTSELRARVMELMKEGADPLLSNYPATFSDAQLRKMFRAIDTVYFKRTLSAWLAPFFTANDIAFGHTGSATALACVWTVITNRARPCNMCFNRDLWYSVDNTAPHYPKRVDKIPVTSRLEHMVVAMCHELVHVLNSINTVKHNRDHANKDGPVNHAWVHDDRFKTLAHNLFGHKMGHISENVDFVEVVN